MYLVQDIENLVLYLRNVMARCQGIYIIIRTGN